MEYDRATVTVLVERTRHPHDSNPNAGVERADTVETGEARQLYRTPGPWSPLP